MMLGLLTLALVAGLVTMAIQGWSGPWALVWFSLSSCFWLLAFAALSALLQAMQAADKARQEREADQ